MTLKILHLSDTHIGSGFSHGKIDPQTRINTRLQDFIGNLSLCIDRAIAEPVDLVLFGGDAFPDATPPPYVQEAFAQQFRRLADAQIPTILLVGNHDQHAQSIKGATSLSIYETLGVPGFIVGDKITTHRLTTKNGEIQVITLPWLNHGGLLTRQETKDLSLLEVNKLLIDKLGLILESQFRQLDPEIPAVLLGHLMADRADIGAERFLAVGKGFTVPISMLTAPAIDYVALGHVHKHQNLNPSNDPPVIYPGSIERVDFSEEKETKGYVLLNLSKGKADWEFCPLPARPFQTIKIDVSQSEEPEKKIIAAIAKAPIEDAVVRLIYKLKPEQIPEINLNNLNQVLSAAHYHSIAAELIAPVSAPRIPEFNVGSKLDPLEALETYINHQENLQDIATEMLETAKRLLEGEETESEWSQLLLTDQKQLKLL